MMVIIKKKKNIFKTQSLLKGLEDCKNWSLKDTIRRYMLLLDSEKYLIERARRWKKNLIKQKNPTLSTNIAVKNSHIYILIY